MKTATRITKHGSTVPGYVRKLPYTGGQTAPILHGARWTQRQEEILIELWNRTPLLERVGNDLKENIKEMISLSRIIGRTPKATAERLYKLRLLRKAGPFTKFFYYYHHQTAYLLPLPRGGQVYIHCSDL